MEIKETTRFLKVSKGGDFFLNILLTRKEAFLSKMYALNVELIIIIIIYIQFPLFSFNIFNINSKMCERTSAMFAIRACRAYCIKNYDAYPRTDFQINRYRRKRQKVDASIFDSALSHTRRSNASEKKRK